MTERTFKPKAIKTVGVIGLGGLGRAIGQRVLQAAGLEKVVVFDADPSRLASIAETGLIAAKSIAHLVDMADLIALCLPGGADVGRVARSHEGLLDCTRQGQIVIDHSWSPMALMHQLDTAFAARGAAFLDAPIGKGPAAEKAVASGALALAIGGREAAIQAASLVLRCLARDITHVGPAGAAQVTRQMSDLVAFQTFEALAGALMTAKSAGVAADRLLDAFAKGSPDREDITRDALVDMMGEPLREGASQPTIAEAAARLGDAIKIASERSLQLGGAGSMLGLLQQAMEEGRGEQGLGKLFEKRPAQAPARRTGFQRRR